VPGAAVGEFRIRDGASGLCATLDTNLEFVTAVACPDSAADAAQGDDAAPPPGPPAADFASWMHDAREGQLWSKAGPAKLWGQGRCLTAVEPNPLMRAALATRVTDTKVNSQGWPRPWANFNSL
jgi:hypothetical protein